MVVRGSVCPVSEISPRSFFFFFWGGGGVVPGVAFLFRRACVFPASVGSASSVGADHWPLTFPQQSSVTANQLPYIPRCSTVRHAPGRCHACYRLVWSMAIEEERRPPASPASGIASWPLWGLTFCRHPACLWPRARLQWMSALCCCAFFFFLLFFPPLLFLKLDSRVKVHQPALCYSS